MDNIIKFLISIILILLIFYFHKRYENFNVGKCYNAVGEEKVINANGTCSNFCYCVNGIAHNNNNCYYETKQHCYSCDDGYTLDAQNNRCLDATGKYIDINWEEISGEKIAPADTADTGADEADTAEKQADEEARRKEEEEAVAAMKEECGKLYFAEENRCYKMYKCIGMVNKLQSFHTDLEDPKIDPGLAQRRRGQVEMYDKFIKDYC